MRLCIKSESQAIGRTDCNNDLDGTITDGGELTHSYSVESGGVVQMTKQEIIEMIERASFEAVERETDGRET